MAIDRLLASEHSAAVAAESGWHGPASVFQVGDWAVVHRPGFWRSSYALVVRLPDGDLEEMSREGEPLSHLIAMFHPGTLAALREAIRLDAPRPGEESDPDWEYRARQVECVAKIAADMAENHPDLYTPIKWSELPADYLCR